jgi:hypothetical protein
MIAFMDDTSRKIMSWDLLQDKKSATTAEVLTKTLGTPESLKPYMIWMDNGTEYL